MGVEAASGVGVEAGAGAGAGAGPAQPGWFHLGRHPRQLARPRPRRPRRRRRRRRRRRSRRRYCQCPSRPSHPSRCPALPSPSRCQRLHVGRALERPHCRGGAASGRWPRPRPPKMSSCPSDRSVPWPRIRRPPSLQSRATQRFRRPPSRVLSRGPARPKTRAAGAARSPSAAMRWRTIAGARWPGTRPRRRWSGPRPPLPPPLLLRIGPPRSAWP